MNLTKEFSFSVKISALLVISLIFYFLLVISDYFLFRILTKLSSESNIEAQIIEKKRYDTEDVYLIKQAKQEGFKSFIWLSLMENNFKFRQLAMKYNVAPLAPQPNTNLYLCNEGYGLLKYRTDKLGFRNDNENYKKPVDIALIGDSFTHGVCVDQNDTISGKINLKYNSINLGTGGNDPIHYAAIAKVFLPILKPRYATIVFYANDNNVWSASSYYYRYYFK